MTVSLYNDEYVKRLEDDRRALVNGLEKIRQQAMDEWTYDAACDTLNIVMATDFPPKRGTSDWVPFGTVEA